MLKEYTTLFRRLMVIADAAIATAAFFLAYALRNHIDNLYPLNEYILYLPVLMMAWGACLFFLGMYQSFRTRSVFELMYIIFKAMLIPMIYFLAV
jgi:hypothetical protein